MQTALAKGCTKCGVVQPLCNFPPRKTRKDGRCSHCHSCNRAKADAWRVVNLERARSATRAYFAKNREEANASRSDRHRLAMQDAAYRDRHNKSSSRWRAQNPEAAKLYSQQWTRNNPDKNTARAARYRASKTRATPPWVAHDELFPVYELARRLTSITGVLHHVDHIVPLKGKAVCGLHVPWNLRAIPALENTKKGAKLLGENSFA